jgi:hypothetical protein
MKDQNAYKYFDIRNSLFNIHHFFSYSHCNLLCQYRIRGG